MARKVLFITGNAKKLAEVQRILGQGAHAAAFELDSRAVDVPEVQGSTADVAKAKVTAAARAVGGPCFTEDTALAFDALDGLPGPYIKDFMAKLGHQGLNNLLKGFETNAATAVCTFGYCAGPDAEPLLFVGETRGKIVPPRGPPVFGWDAIFEPEEGSGKTFAEMEADEKNAISHRYRALDKLRSYLLSEQGQTEVAQT